MVGPIARSVKRRCPESIDTEDLEQVGRLALSTAVAKYDPARAASFFSYIRTRIRGAMLDAIRGPEFREASRERDAVRIDTPSSPVIRASGRPTAEPWLDAAIARLPERQAKILTLRYRQDFTQLETAAAIGVSRTTVAREERAALISIRRSTMQTEETTPQVTPERAPFTDFLICRAIPERKHTVKATIREPGGGRREIFRQKATRSAAVIEYAKLERQFAKAEFIHPLKIQSSPILGFTFRDHQGIQPSISVHDDKKRAIALASVRCLELQAAEKAKGRDTFFAIIDRRTTKVLYVTPDPTAKPAAVDPPADLPKAA